MNSLKECLQSDLNLIGKKINDNNCNTDLIDSNLDFILSLADDQNIDLDYPKILQDYINNYVDNDEVVTKEYIDNYHKCKDFNVSLCNVCQKINDEYNFKLVYPRFKEKLCLDEAIKITGSFFKEYDRDIYDYYDNFIANGKFFTVKKIYDNYGLSSRSDQILEPYLFMANMNSIRNITVLAHEIIHMYLSEKQKYLNDRECLNIYVNNIDEVYSHYIEYIVLDYLENLGFNNRDIINYKKSMYTELIKHADNFYNFLEPVDINFEDEEDIDWYDDLKKYTYGLYFLYHFYDQYLLDKDMAKENITNFMLDSKNKEFNYLINNYGLSEDKLKDHKVLLRHIEKIY